MPVCVIHEGVIKHLLCLVTYWNYGNPVSVSLIDLLKEIDPPNFLLYPRLPGFLGELDDWKKFTLRNPANNRVFNHVQKVPGCWMPRVRFARKVRGTHNRNTQEPGTFRKVLESRSI
jgi:hypothetical protein